MGHGVLNLVFDTNPAGRGDDKTFVSGMLMGMARRRSATARFNSGDGQSRSADGQEGLSAPAGQRRNGKRGRPSHRPAASARFLRGVVGFGFARTSARRAAYSCTLGFQGEPAFGPPAFMHREAILDSPEAPISHHWLDSTHISFGVLTAGIVADRLQVRSQPFQRPRTGPTSVEYRDRLAGFDFRSRLLEPDANAVRCREAGAISSIRSNSSRASTRRGGRPARSLRTRSRAGWKFAGNDRLGQKAVEGRRRRRVRCRSFAQERPLDNL